MSLAKNYLTSLSRKPSDNDSHNWADYLELLCIANIDGELSEEDVIDRLSLRLKDLKEGSKKEISTEKELNSDALASASNRARISDKWETQLRDWFSILKMREAAYKEFYPFKVNNREITFKSSKQTLKQKLYIYLLLCSNLYLFSKQNSNTLSDSFEVLSLESFKNVLPTEAEIHLFGKNSLNKTGPFRGSYSFWKKVNNLAGLINDSIATRMKEVDYPAKNTGDGGLDIVAWIPTYDDLQSKIIFLGQCACGEWRKKVYESSYETWSEFIDFTTYPINNIFIPYCFRQSNGNWHKPAYIKKAFLIDRKRILDYCCRKRVLNYKRLPAHNIVDEILITKESVI